MIRADPFNPWSILRGGVMTKAKASLLAAALVLSTLILPIEKTQAADTISSFTVVAE